MADLRYPVGQFHAPAQAGADERAVWIEQIAKLPAELAAAVDGLDSSQLDTPYREGGWSVRQLVHHVADSHMNSVVRFRWTLTEDVPLIKAYEEKAWAELPDARSLPVKVSLQLLEGLHQRWVTLLRAMTSTDFDKRLRHPVSGELSLTTMLGLYAWHGRHHVAHVTELRRRMNW